MKIANAYQLIDQYRKKQPTGHFFDPETLEFFGEKTYEMRLLKELEDIEDYDGIHRCYVLTSIQHKHPLGKRIAHHYFDAVTLENIRPML